MLTPEMKDAIARTEIFPFATASRSGIPNVVPVRCLHVARDDRLWIMDNYFHKTLTNLRDNPQAAIFVWPVEPKICFQIKGIVELMSEGDEYEAMKAKVHLNRPDLPARSLVAMQIHEIYQCLPGADAGKMLYPAG